MNTPADIRVTDLIRLALTEFRRYEAAVHEGRGINFDQFTSANLARELIREAIELAEHNEATR